MGTNQEVREILGAPSLQCLILRRRLMLLISVARSGMPHLEALISCRVAGGSPLPWVKLVQQDLCTLAAFHEEKLAELGSPLTNASAWWVFMQAFPGPFTQLIKEVHITTMPLDGASVKCGDAAAVHSIAFAFRCSSVH